MIKKPRPSTSAGVIKNLNGNGSSLQPEAAALPAIKDVKTPAALDLLPAMQSFAMIDPAPLVITSPLLSTRRSGTRSSKRRARTPLLFSSTETPENVMLLARQARKKAEEDVKLLGNRLKNLKIEEEKALARVKKIQNRAAEVVNLKQSKQETRRYLNSRRESRHRKAEKDQRLVQQTIQETKSRIKASRGHVHNSNKDAAGDLRRMKKKMADELVAYKKSEEERLRLRNAEMRFQREERQRKKEENWRIRNEKVAEDYARRIAEEAQAASEAAALRKKLEEDEMKMIERLKSAQVDQKKAYERLLESIRLADPS